MFKIPYKIWSKRNPFKGKEQNERTFEDMKKDARFDTNASSHNKEPNFLEKWYNKIISKFLRIFNVIFNDDLLH